MLLSSKNLDDYLEESSIIDIYDLDIVSLSKSLSKGDISDIEIARRAFEFVRDDIRHT